MKLLDWCILLLSILVFVAGFIQLSNVQYNTSVSFKYPTLEQNVTLYLFDLSQQEMQAWANSSIITEVGYVTIPLTVKNKSGDLFYNEQLVKPGSKILVNTDTMVFHGRVQP